MAFPFETDSEVANEDVLKIPREYEIDYSTGQLTGRIVEGAEAVKIWAYNALNTSRYRHLIYSWDYGNELEDMIGQTWTNEDVKSAVNECLLINPNITGTDNYNIDFTNDKLSISFTMNTIFGEVKINV